MEKNPVYNCNKFKYNSVIDFCCFWCSVRLILPIYDVALWPISIFRDGHAAGWLAGWSVGSHYANMEWHKFEFEYHRINCRVYAAEEKKRRPTRNGLPEQNMGLLLNSAQNQWANRIYTYIGGEGGGGWSPIGMFVRNANAAKAHINRITCRPGCCYYKILPSFVVWEEESFLAHTGTPSMELKKEWVGTNESWEMGYLSHFGP